MSRIDAHTHLVPAAYRAALERNGFADYPLPPTTAEQLSDSMDRYEIDASIVSLSPPGVWFGDAGLARDLARLVNEETAALVRARPDRFGGLATLPLSDVDAALAEIDYALDELGLDGVALLSNIDGTYLGDVDFDPVFDELERRGAYVFVHPTEPRTPSPMPDVPVWVQEFPFDTTRAVVNLIYSGTLERCPHIRLQVSHLGGAVPFLAHRIAELADREPDRAEAAPAGALAYLQRLYYDTGLANNPVALASVRELAGLERVVFGTDWPYGALPEGADPAPGLGLGDEERAAVDAANVAALVPRLARWSGVPFALGTFAHDGEAAPYLVIEERAYDLRPLLGAEVTVRGLVDRWPERLAQLQALADSGCEGVEPLELGGLRALPPLQPVGQIFQAAANYRQHVLDLIAAAERRGDGSDGHQAGERDRARRLLDERAANGRPFVFLGSAHAMVGAEDDVVLPADTHQPDWELELAAVIGRRARRVQPERALELVAGYTIANDLTSRDALAREDAGTLGLDTLAAKNSPTFLPTGPLLVPAVHAGDPMDLRIELTVNGRTMQDESTADMLFDVARLISYLTEVAELRPGDLVLTGSPAGNGAAHGVFLAPGDLIEGTITGLGSQRNRCVAERPGA